MRENADRCLSNWLRTEGIHIHVQSVKYRPPQAIPFGAEVSLPGAAKDDALQLKRTHQIGQPGAQLCGRKTGFGKVRQFQYESPGQAVAGFIIE